MDIAILHSGAAGLSAIPSPYCGNHFRSDPDTLRRTGRPLMEQDTSVYASPPG